MQNTREFPMNPHRFAPASFIFRQLSALPAEPASGVLAALLAILASFWNVQVVLLLILVVVSGAVDLEAGARRATVRERLNLGESYSEKILREGMRAKAFYLFVSLFLGIAVDALVATFAGHLDLGFAGLFKSITPATCAMLFWRFRREVRSTLRNIDQTPGGKDAIFPFAARIIDEIRWRGTPGTSGPLPRERWGDGITPEERNMIDRILMEHRGERRSGSSHGNPPAGVDHPTNRAYSPLSVEEEK